MKNIKKYAIGLLATVVLAQSCREEYLNEPVPTSVVSANTVYGSVEGATAHLAGILRNTRGQFANMQTDSGNLASMYFARTVKGNDIINARSWFSFDYAHENREATYRRTRFSWRFPYAIINQLNVFIKELKASTDISESDKQPLLAQALTMRAEMYFELSLEFQHTYQYNPDLPAPPIYTEEDANSLEGKPMSTQRALYAQITSDIEEAIRIGNDSRIDKSYYNKQVSYGLGARVYQVMAGNTNNSALWTKAAEYAEKAYGGNVDTALDATAYANGFKDMNANKEWILALPQSSDQSAYYWMAPGAFMDHTTTSYQNTYVNKTLVESFTDTDVRKLFVDTGASNYTKYYTTKFKFGFDSHVSVMRTAEMILIHAEALRHISGDAAARALLYKLQKNRDVNAVESSNEGDALLEEILKERRKELYGEIGVEWFDAKRLQRGISRDGEHRLRISLDANDKRFFLKIPQEEIDANSNINASVNNDR